MKENFFGDEIEKIVFISDEQLKNRTLSKIYGKFFEDTNIYNVFPIELQDKGDFLCDILPQGSTPNNDDFCAIYTDNSIEFYSNCKKLKIEEYSLYQNIFSRNRGILETDIMSKKRAVILGCGSVGSLVAMELARSGVGNFLLVDPDVMEYHNICRHQCGIEDVGDLKINALTRKLKNINPSVHVEKYEGVVENLPKNILDEFCKTEETIFVGCADNREADVYANRISIYYSAYFISLGFWERACAGEIFYHLPNKGMPCYECALGRGANVSSRVQANHHVYSNKEDIEAVKFEPGISVDINFITTIGIKLIIDILNNNNKDYIPRLLNHLKQYTIVCNTNNPEIGGEMLEIFSYPLQITTSLVVGFNKKECKEKCTCKYELEDK